MTKPLYKRFDWMSLKCPVCQRNAIGKIKGIAICTCGYHYWEYAENKTIILESVNGQNG